MSTIFSGMALCVLAAFLLNKQSKAHACNAHSEMAGELVTGGAWMLVSIGIAFITIGLFQL